MNYVKDFVKKVMFFPSYWSDLYDSLSLENKKCIRPCDEWESHPQGKEGHSDCLFKALTHNQNYSIR